MFGQTNAAQPQNFLEPKAFIQNMCFFSKLALCLAARERLSELELKNGTQGVLGHVYCAGADRGFHAADLVVAAGDDSDWDVQLVGGVPERVVLTRGVAHLASTLPDSSCSSRSTIRASRYLATSLLRCFFISFKKLLPWGIAVPKFSAMV